MSRFQSTLRILVDSMKHARTFISGYKSELYT